MNDQSYHEDFHHVSKTMLSCFVESPAEYNRRYIEKSAPMPTYANTDIGSIVHEVLLEGRDFKDVVVEYPAECLSKSGSLISTKVYAFKQTLPDNVYPLKPKHVKHVQGIIEAGLRRLELETVSNPIREEPIYWTQYLLSGEEIKCRCKPDQLEVFDDYVLVTDLKVTEQPRPRDFRRVMSRFQYWLQDAHYSAGIFEKYGLPVRFRFLVVENGPAARTGIYEYNEGSRLSAKSEWELILGDLISRMKTGDWSDNWTKETTLVDLYPSETPYMIQDENEEVIYDGE